MIEHANLPVRENEKRSSFVQYAAGGLFRWTDYGFQTTARFVVNNPEREQELKAGELTSWSESLNKLSLIDELQKDHITAGPSKHAA